MQFAVLGLNHKTAPVAVRECYSFSEEQVKTALQHLGDYSAIEECVILSTCNRTEMYAVVSDADEARSEMSDLLKRMSAKAAPVTEFLFYYTAEQCIRHLFRVAASLDSLVIGEGQILSQVKKAYTLARNAGTTSTMLNTLFNRAIAVGKRVRTETRIAYSAVSVSYAAVELAKRLLGTLSQSNVLLLGAGQMSELTARHLVENGVHTVFVSNRNYERAVELAERFHGIAVPFMEFADCAEKADIVITSTGAPHYIVTAWNAAHMMQLRGGKPIIFIDIAVPRDVEPEVGEIAGVALYNIDDLEAVVVKNRRERAQEAKIGEALIESEIAELRDKLRYLSFRPMMARLADKAEQIRRRELKRALAKLPGIAPEQRRVLDNMSRMMMRKFLRDPMIKMNEAAGSDNEEFYAEAISKLFKLDELGETAYDQAVSHYRYAREQVGAVAGRTGS